MCFGDELIRHFLDFSDRQKEAARPWTEAAEKKED